MYKTFADGARLYSNVNTTTASLRLCIYNIVIWASIWQLKLSSSKCSVLSIGKNISNYMYAINDSIHPQLTCSTDFDIEVGHLLVCYAQILTYIRKQSKDKH